MYKRFEKIVAMMLFAISFTVLLSGCGATTIKMTDYITMEFTGIDGKGEADVAINKDSLYRKIFGEDVTAESATAQQEKTITAIKSALEYKIDKADKLSNGDIVTVSFPELSDLPKEMKVAFSDSIKEFTVEGLTVPKSVDPFEYAKVQFTGIAPFATAKVENTAKEVPYQSFQFSAAPAGNLSNGDTITITASCKESTLDNAAIVLSATEKTVTVEGVSEYVTDFVQIPQIIHDEIAKEAQDLSSAYFSQYYLPIMNRLTDTISSGRSNVTVSNYRQYTAYLLCIKDGKTSEKRNDTPIINQIQVVCSLDGSDAKTSAPVTGYFVACFNNFILNSDGTVQYDTVDTYAMGEYFSLENQYSTSIEPYKDNYTVEEKKD